MVLLARTVEDDFSARIRVLNYQASQQLKQRRTSNSLLGYLKEKRVHGLPQAEELKGHS